jgi:hypothetical protein
MGGLYWPSSFLWKSDSATCRIGPRPPHQVVTIDPEGKTRKNYKLRASPIDGPPDPAVRARGECDVAASAQQRRSGEVAAETALRRFPPAGPLAAKVPLSTSSATLRIVKSDVAVEAQSSECGWQPYGDVM